MNPEIRERLELAREAVVRDPSEVALADLAELAAVSPYHFHRLYRRAFGETPLETATKTRLNESIRRLRESSESIVEICVEVGYSSPTSFAAWFAAHAGCSPTKYREHCRIAQDSRRIAGFPKVKLNLGMKARISVITLFVLDQEESLNFYTEKLGFELASDVKTPDGFRWLTVALPDSDVQLVLFPISTAIGCPKTLSERSKPSCTPVTAARAS